MEMHLFTCISISYYYQVEDVMSRTAEGASAVQDLDFGSLASQLSPLAVVCPCRLGSDRTAL